ncbi:MAG: hypothetical protein WAM95_17325 [Bacillus sp. (in: firmicutes)]
MSLAYQLTLSRESVKFLKKQEKIVKERIIKGLNGLTIHPPVGDIKRLKCRKGKTGWHL